MIADYKTLPEPLRLNSEPAISYYMQLLIIPNEQGTSEPNTVIKAF